MPIIKDAISDLLGIDPDWNWSEHLQQASFRGVPFGVISGESVSVVARPFMNMRTAISPG
ncbi:hypothetical protein [Morganella morganii]|uniref:hypothetical protein n=1 Tax=Morganella morganii TaxID=582 RepID=UPI00066292D8|nr:hypothetical protein [Morganella morganii]